MTPLPTPPEVSFTLPDFHLHAIRLEHRGSQLFFQHGLNPYQLLKESSERVLRSLYPSALHGVKVPQIRSVSLKLAEEAGGVAYTTSSELDEEHKEIVLSTSYLENVYDKSGGNSERLLHEIEGVLTHELVHVFQYDGRGTLPGGVVEGVADWIREMNNLGPPHWHEGPSQDEIWDAGYQTTGFFLKWLSKHYSNPLLVPQLNMAMSTSQWDDGKHLKKLLNGESVEHLWEIYKKSLSNDSQNAPAPIPTHTPGYRARYA